MKIDCILRRKGGTTVNLGGRNVDSHIKGGKNYHFTPGQNSEGEDLDGPHLCDVRDQEHVAKLLSIPDSFRIYDPDGKLVGPREGDGKPATTPAGKGAGDIGNPGSAAGSQTVDPAAKYVGLSDAELIADFEKRTGKKPHPNAKRDSIVRTLCSLDSSTKQKDSDSADPASKVA